MQTTAMEKFIKFLEDDLGVPSHGINLALRHPEQNINLLPIILWQYGLVTLSQLDEIFDWLDNFGL
jgi:Protein of unknown function (DUF2949)